MPQTMKIYAIAMEFKNLCKIRSPVNFCEGFCLQEFDEMIEVSFFLSLSLSLHVL